VAKQREMEQEKAAPCGREQAANQVLGERASERALCSGDGCSARSNSNESFAHCGIIAARGPEESKREKPQCATHIHK
jgi:hypothetical protein